MHKYQLDIQHQFGKMMPKFLCYKVNKQQNTKNKFDFGQMSDIINTTQR